MSVNLPNTIQYLADAISHLDALPNDELNEDADVLPLSQALETRLSGLSIEEAQLVIESDCEELTNWVRQNSDSTPGAQFALGFLSLPDLARQIVEPSTDEFFAQEVHIDLPSELQPLRQFGRVDASFGAVSIAVSPLDELGHNCALAHIKHHKPLPGMTTTLERVQFGSVFGQRHVIRDSWGVAIHYVLNVPGGFADVCIMGEGNCDESTLEPFLHTLHIQ